MLAQWALEDLTLDEVWFIPTGVSYMKNSREIVSGQHRLCMTQLAVRDNPLFRCLDTEVRRGGYTYSCETVELLCHENPEDLFYFIAGADCLFAIETWREPERIFRCCALVAATRGETGLERMEEKKRDLEDKYQFCREGGPRIILLPFVGMSVSSTEIRSRIRAEKSVRYLVPDSVITYMEEKGLYSEEDDSFEKAEKSDEKSAGREEV